MQECVIQRLSAFKKAHERFLIHHLACKILTKLLSDVKHLEVFKIQKQTVSDLSM